MMAGADRSSQGQVLQKMVKNENVHRVNRVKIAKINLATAVNKG